MYRRSDFTSAEFKLEEKSTTQDPKHALPEDAMHEAAARGDVDQMRTIYEADPASINRFHSINGTTPICWALQKNKWQVVAFLQERRADFTRTQKPHLRFSPYAYLEEFRGSYGYLSDKINELGLSLPNVSMSDDEFIFHAQGFLYACTQIISFAVSKNPLEHIERITKIDQERFRRFQSNSLDSKRLRLQVLVALCTHDKSFWTQAVMSEISGLVAEILMRQQDSPNYETIIDLTAILEPLDIAHASIPANIKAMMKALLTNLVDNYIHPNDIRLSQYWNFRLLVRSNDEEFIQRLDKNYEVLRDTLIEHRLSTVPDRIPSILIDWRIRLLQSEGPRAIRREKDAVYAQKMILYMDAYCHHQGSRESYLAFSEFLQNLYDDDIFVLIQTFIRYNQSIRTLGPVCTDHLPFIRLLLTPENLQSWLEKDERNYLSQLINQIFLLLALPYSDQDKVKTYVEELAQIMAEPNEKVFSYIAKAYDFILEERSFQLSISGVSESLRINFLRNHLQFCSRYFIQSPALVSCLYNLIARDNCLRAAYLEMLSDYYKAFEQPALAEAIAQLDLQHLGTIDAKGHEDYQAGLQAFYKKFDEVLKLGDTRLVFLYYQLASKYAQQIPSQVKDPSRRIYWLNKHQYYEKLYQAQTRIPTLSHIVQGSSEFNLALFEELNELKAELNAVKNENQAMREQLPAAKEVKTGETGRSKRKLSGDKSRFEFKAKLSGEKKAENKDSEREQGPDKKFKESTGPS